MRKFTKSAYQNASRNFDPTEANTDLSGKTIMITGANQGIGLAAARMLAKRGCNLYLVCRNRERGEEAVKEIVAESGNRNVHLLVCDVSSVSDIRKLSFDFGKSTRSLHVLINNAGVMIKPPAKSADGLEINFATNTLGSYALTRAMEPFLKRSAPSKVIFVSSGGALLEGLEVNDLEGSDIINSARFHETQYSRDKRRQIALAEGLSREWASSKVFAYSMHPGWAETESVKTSIPDFYSRFKDSLRTPDQGADTIAWLAGMEDERLENGGYYLDRSPQSKHLPLSRTSYPEDDVIALMLKLDHIVKPILLEAQS